jgi:hypothetical protein
MDTVRRSQVQLGLHCIRVFVIHEDVIDDMRAYRVVAAVAVAVAEVVQHAHLHDTAQEKTYEANEKGYRSVR